tara:strand:- start:499 stop:603 length:105 start_codon:yes stop_codon:yes gene_type:complete
MIEIVAEIMEFIAGSWYKGRKKKSVEPTEENSNE